MSISYLPASIIFLSLILHATSQSVKGHWEKTWRTPSTAQAGLNIGIAFSGHADVDKAIKESSKTWSRLKGRKFISIGGGNKAGRWTRQVLNQVNYAIRNRKFRGYEGIAFDVEEGDSGLIQGFEDTFQLAKRHGFIVLVAISHSAPYNVPDKVQLMHSFLRSRNIDFISPMLYSSGLEFQCDGKARLSTSAPYLPWSAYRGSQAKIIPSILYIRHYADARAFMRRQGVTTHGYIKWCP